MTDQQTAASTMMVKPLLLSQIVDYAAEVFGYQEIVSVGADGTSETISFRDFGDRCRRAARAMQTQYDVAMGERVATLAWTTRSHLELYFALPGLGAVIHTVNPRYSDAQIVYILNHAGNRVAFVDPDQVDRVHGLASQCPKLKHVVALDAAWDDTVTNTAPLEAWPDFPETAGSSMCYTSGTTGEPKGVVYSQRSTVLYTLSGLATGKLPLGSRACALLCVPMYHVNGWCKPFQAMVTGSKIVLPGKSMSGAALHKMIEAHGVTCGFGVPTVWLGLVEHLRGHNLDAGSLQSIGFGGGRVPRSLLAALRDDYGVAVETGYGMTETTTGLGLGSDGPDYWAGDAETQLDLLARQRPIFGNELRVDADREETAGELQIKGHFVISHYFDNAAADATSFTEDGWFRTGDIVSLDDLGRLTVEDRLKDLIKSGGEWISSLALEQAACQHSDVMEAAAIGLPHPKWSERPLLIVSAREGSNLLAEDVSQFLADRVQSWWRPDAIVFETDLPRTATGKTNKKALRAAYSGWSFDASGALHRG
ncbi:MAG: AMP-binding protein [Pseudomonadota bacterium]